MRVLISIDAVGGVFNWALDLVRGLRALDVEAVVATMGPPPRADQRHELERAGAVALHTSTLRLEWMADAGADVAAGTEWLLELAVRERVDAVHLSSYAHAAGSWPVPVLVTGHSCVASWWRAVHGEDSPPALDRYRLAVRAGIAGASAVSAPTAAMLSELRRLHGPLPAQATVIANGSSAPEAPTLVVKEPFVLTAGRLWDLGKNTTMLDGVAARLRAPVLAAGAVDDGFGQRTPTTALRALGTLPGPALAEVRRRALVFAAPARYEPFGLAALEAARDRCALVLGDIPSLREVWGDAAVYVRPDDPDQLCAVLERLLDDPSSARLMGDRALRRAARYTAFAMAEAHAALYRRLCRTAVMA